MIDFFAASLYPELVQAEAPAAKTPSPLRGERAGVRGGVCGDPPPSPYPLPPRGERRKTCNFHD